MKSSIVIIDPNKLVFVAGFSHEHQVVQTTDSPETAKTFKTHTAARKWLISHSDCGYGISSADFRVSTITELEEGPGRPDDAALHNWYAGLKECA